jgi:hypothetical protein
MKYGILSFGDYSNNHGDNMQSLGVYYVYKSIGVKDEDIVWIPKSAVSDYRGAPLLLLYACWENQRFDTSDIMFGGDIIPVFYGIFLDDQATLEKLEKYKHFGPFACRDLETARRMRRAGFDAFDGGCLSLAHPRRTDNPETQNKVFFYDVPEEAKKFIPKKLLENCEWLSAVVVNDKPTDNMPDTLAMTEKICNEAKLVVTYRLHGSLPFAAMGIPVVLLQNNSNTVWDSRHSGYGGLITRYVQRDFDKVDWIPPPPTRKA